MYTFARSISSAMVYEFGSKYIRFNHLLTEFDNSNLDSYICKNNKSKRENTTEKKTVVKRFI